MSVSSDMLRRLKLNEAVSKNINVSFITCKETAVSIKTGKLFHCKKLSKLLRKELHSNNYVFFCRQEN